MITDEQYYSISDRAHFLGAAAACLAGQVIYHRYGLLVSGVSIIVFAAVKEFVIDPKMETKEIAGSAWRDFLAYCAGAFAALVLCGIKAKWPQ